MNTTEQVFLFGQVEDGSSYSGKQMESNEVDHEQPMAAPTLASVQDLSCVCRICATPNDYLIPIFEGEGLQNNIADKINKHLPIKVTETDSLPRQLCYHCASTVLAWVELVDCCTQSNLALRNKQDSLLKNVVQTGESNKTDKEDIDNRSAFCRPALRPLQPTLRPLKDSASQRQKHFANLLLSSSRGPLDVNKIQPPIVNGSSLLTSRTEKNDLQLSPKSDISVDDFYYDEVPIEYEKGINVMTKDESDDDDEDDKPLTAILKIKNEADMFNNFYKALVNFKKHYEKSHKSKRVIFLEDPDSNDTEVSDGDDSEMNYVGDSGNKYDDLTVNYKRRDMFDEKTRNDLNKARKTVNGRVYYECPLCSRNLRSTYTYIFHMRIHSGEKPCVCHLCGKQFRVNAGLQRHIKETHHKIKMHSCTICSSTFVNKQNLMQHQRIHTGERPYVCSQCGKRFKQSGSLYIHSKIHTDNYPYECNTCDAKFRQKSGLKHHMYKHSGERPNVCTYCGKAYRIKHDLNNHMLIHSELRPYMCPLCGQSFRQRRTLRNHCKKTHDCLPC